MCSKLTIKTAERREWSLSDVIIVKFEHISHLALVFLLLTLSSYMPAGTEKAPINGHPNQWTAL